MTPKSTTLLLFITYLFFSFQSGNATLIQILHTNDTHSYLDRSIHDKGLGGMAELKSLIDFYKNKMNQEGVPTIVMDAGDFTEGNFYYLANKGRSVFDIHNEMGYDIGTMGNHDYLMGTRELDRILGEMDLKFSFILANFQIDPSYKNILNKIKPFKEIEIEGIKIAIFGLTTNQIFYKWRFDGGKITNPLQAAKTYENILKQRKNDFIIALTHIGVLNDIRLAEQSSNIDLIVGGHSHTALFKPLYGKNIGHHPVPIVQAGMHTEYLGRLIINLEKGAPLKIVSYELVPIKYEAYDDKIKSLMIDANNDLDKTYGKEWLEERIGHSDLKVEDKDGVRKWGIFIADSIREKVHADIAIHTPFMNGDDFPVGDISRRDLFNSFPRIFELTEKYGWNIYTAKIKGMWLKTAFDTLKHFGQPLIFSGINIVYVKDSDGDITFKHILINGKEINPFKSYSVAFTEGIVRGAEGASSKSMAILQHPIRTDFKVWQTLEEQLAQKPQRTILSQISDENHFLLMPNK